MLVINAIKFGFKVKSNNVVTHNKIQYYHSTGNMVYCNHAHMGMVAGKQCKTILGGIVFTAVCYYILNA